MEFIKNKKILVLLLMAGVIQAGNTGDETQTPEELKKVREFKFSVITAESVPAPKRGRSLRSQGSSPFLPIQENEVYTDIIYTKEELEERKRKEAKRVAAEAREVRRARSAGLFQTKSDRLDRSKWKRGTTKSCPLETLAE